MHTSLPSYPEKAGNGPVPGFFLTETPHRWSSDNGIQDWAWYMVQLPLLLVTFCFQQGTVPISGYGWKKVEEAHQLVICATGLFKGDHP